MAEPDPAASLAGPAHAVPAYAPGPGPGSGLVACVDFGSTFTKAALVELPGGRLVATSEHPTTLTTDLLDGWHACREALLRVDPAAGDAAVLACSSAGGGLRIAVVGQEELVSAEAGRRVALTSGGRVVYVGAAGRWSVAALASARPDVVLLVGGTDGGNAEAVLAAAADLAGARWPGPVVVAGNVEAQAETVRILAAAGTPYRRAGNVVPRIGVLAPDSARAAIREVFLTHVIGGKHLSRRPELGEMLCGATPEVVLRGVELLARGLGPDRPGAGDVVVVDVGGATTDVHSVVQVDPEEAGTGREVVATAAVTRTVEGDLGMRSSAATTVEAGHAAGLLGNLEEADLAASAQARSARPDYLPEGAEAAAHDLRLAEVAVALALRRHAGRSQVVYGPQGRVVERSGRDLRQVRLVLGSGGVLRHAGAAATGVLTRHLGDEGGWQLPAGAAVALDRDYVLAAAGLLAAHHPEAAHTLLSDAIHADPA